ncbi:hypothetical protein MSAN_00629300 [Mycena sanguinolenta]|uniref:Uncharacterized protein n=1 Tax=Mycena sanguinolenta TaxID=230812 RepID=A0A8H6Z3S7_9AGAR|nr:hypothetical protein MSAN_00629300 [Mycena sanguinolenta]
MTMIAKFRRNNHRHQALRDAHPAAPPRPQLGHVLAPKPPTAAHRIYAEARRANPQTMCPSDAAPHEDVTGPWAFLHKAEPLELAPNEVDERRDAAAGRAAGTRAARHRRVRPGVGGKGADGGGEDCAGFPKFSSSLRPQPHPVLIHFPRLYSRVKNSIPPGVDVFKDTYPWHYERSRMTDCEAALQSQPTAIHPQVLVVPSSAGLAG